MEYATVWWFRWKDENLPIIEGNAEAMDPDILEVLLQKTIGIIEQARQFYGVPYSDLPSQINEKLKVRVSFSLLFPTYECANEFLRYIDQKEHI